MQLIVDTEKDSKEDIRKAVAFLSSLADKTISKTGNIFEDSGSFQENTDKEEVSDAGTNAFSSMFGNDSGPASKSEDDIKIEDDEEEEKETPEIIEY